MILFPGLTRKSEGSGRGEEGKGAEGRDGGDEMRVEG